MNNPFQDLVSSETIAAPSKSNNPFHELAVKEESKIHPAKAIIQQGARKFLSEAIASPRTAAEIVSSLSHTAAEKGVQQKIKSGEVPEEDKFTQNVLKVLDVPKNVLQKFWPNAESAERGIKKVAEFLGSEQTPIEPETTGQERAAKIGSFAGSSVLGGPKKLAERFLLGTAGGIGAQAGKETLGEGSGEFTGALTFPAFLALAFQIKNGQWNPSNKILQALKTAGKRDIGLTEAEITPLLQSDAKIATLGRIATGTSKSAKALESAETKLSSSYENLKNDSKSFPGLSGSQRGKMLDSFDDIVTNLRKSALPSDEKLKVIHKIEGAINHFGANGVHAEDIIETWLDINKTVNWKSYSGGKKDLAALKAPLKEALHEIDPKLAQRFDDLNALWGKIKNIASRITDKDMKKWVDYGEAYATLGSLVSAVLTGNWAPLKVAIGTVASRRLANKMLTDPKYQDIFRRSVNAIKSSNKAEGLKLLKELNLETNQPENNKDHK